MAPKWKPNAQPAVLPTCGPAHVQSCGCSTWSRRGARLPGEASVKQASFSSSAAVGEEHPQTTAWNEQEEAAPSRLHRCRLLTAGCAARWSEDPVHGGSSGRTAARHLTVGCSVSTRPSSKPGIISQKDSNCLQKKAWFPAAAFLSPGREPPESPAGASRGFVQDPVC